MAPALGALAAPVAPRTGAARGRRRPGFAAPGAVVGADVAIAMIGDTGRGCRFAAVAMVIDRPALAVAGVPAASWLRRVDAA